jgi:hypothetical protein
MRLSRQRKIVILRYVSGWHVFGRRLHADILLSTKLARKMGVSIGMVSYIVIALSVIYLIGLMASVSFDVYTVMRLYEYLVTDVGKVID